MLKIFIGLLFLFIDYNINGVSVTPGFVGYILVWFGMNEVRDCFTFTRAKPLVLIAAAISAFTWARSFIVGETVDSLGLLLTAGNLMLQLFITYSITQGVVELQNATQLDLKARSLLRTWNVMAMGSVSVFVFRMLFYPLAMAALVIYFIASIYYAIRFFQGSRAYPKARV